MTTKETLLARRDELTKSREQIAAQLAPVQAELDAKVADIENQKAAMAPLVKRVQELRAPLFDIDNELSLILRALGGKSMGGAR